MSEKEDVGLHMGEKDRKQELGCVILRPVLGNR